MAVLHQPNSNRFAAAIFGSMALNFLLWGVMAAGASRVAPIPPARTMKVSRVVIDPKTNVVKPHVVKPAPKPAVKIPEQKDPPKPVVHEHQKPPPPIRNKVITAPPSKSNSPSDSKGFTAPPDGNAKVGDPKTGQDQGAIKPNPPDPPKSDPPKTDPPKTDPPKTDPPKTDPPKADPPKVDPPKADPPKPKGPTKDAEPMNQVEPQIPDSMKSQDLKAFVRVKVEISEDGTFEVILRTSSGKPEVDDLILSALKRWKWKPAVKDGEPVRSTKLFKFEIEVK